MQAYAVIPAPNRNIFYGEFEFQTAHEIIQFIHVMIIERQKIVTS